MTAASRRAHAASTATLLALLTAGGLIRPPAAPAAPGEFVPQPVRNGLVLQLGGRLDRDEEPFQDGQRRTEDRFFKERLLLESEGFSYHPRFLQYRLRLAFALTQEDYSATGLESVRHDESAPEYDVRLHLLPEHPYSLRLHAASFEPLVPQQLSDSAGTRYTTRGAAFRFKSKPYFLNLHYDQSETDTREYHVDVDTMGGNAEYFRDLGGGRSLSFSGAATHSLSRTDDGFDGTADTYGLANTIRQKAFSLWSSIAGDSFHQDAALGDSDGDTTTWIERLSLTLPAHLRSVAYYRQQWEDLNNDYAVPSGQASWSNDSRLFDFELVHNLYKSLETKYQLRWADADSQTGGQSTLSHTLAANYVKTNPWGITFAGVHVGRLDFESDGTATVLNEQHPRTALNEPFTTRRDHADCQSVAVLLDDPGPGQLPVPVTFQVQTAPDDRCEIVVTALPPEYDAAVPHDYLVTYSLQAASYTLRSDTFGFNVNLQLFDNNVNPYLSYDTLEPSLVDGTYPWELADTTVITTGLILGTSPLRVQAEYQDAEAATPFRRWRGEITYDRALGEALHVRLAGSYRSTRYPEGASTAQPEPYTEKASLASADLQWRPFSRAVLLTARGSYSHNDGLYTSTGYTLGTSLLWKIGTTTITAGATTYQSTSDYDSRAGGSLDRSYERYYVTLERRFL